MLSKVLIKWKSSKMKRQSIEFSINKTISRLVYATLKVKVDRATQHITLHTCNQWIQHQCLYQMLEHLIPYATQNLKTGVSWSTHTMIQEDSFLVKTLILNLNFQDVLLLHFTLNGPFQLWIYIGAQMMTNYNAKFQILMARLKIL